MIAQGEALELQCIWPLTVAFFPSSLLLPLHVYVCVCVWGLGGGYFMDSVIENLESGLMNVSKHGTKCNLVLPDNKCLILLP